MFFRVVQPFLRCFWTLRLPIADFSVQATSNALLQPEVLVGHAHEKFDADGRLVHEHARFPRDVSPALYRTDRASRYGRGQDHDITADRWPACRR